MSEKTIDFFGINSIGQKLKDINRNLRQFNVSVEVEETEVNSVCLNTPPKKKTKANTKEMKIFETENIAPPPLSPLSQIIFENDQQKEIMNKQQPQGRPTHSSTAQTCPFHVNKKNELSVAKAPTAKRGRKSKVANQNETNVTVAPASVTTTKQTTAVAKRGRKSKVANQNETNVTVAPASVTTTKQKTAVAKRGRKSKVANQNETNVTVAPASVTTTKQKPAVAKRGRKSKVANQNETNVTVAPASVTTTKQKPAVARRGRKSKVANQNETNVTVAPTSVTTTKQKTPVTTRRQCAILKERVSRAKVIDTIDLVTPVQPYVREFVSLDSDDEKREDETATTSFISPNATTVLKSSLECSFNADNPELPIKIRWNGVIEKYQLRKYQKFSHIMQKIADRENAPIEDVVLNLESKLIKQYDTPDSIGYKAYHFISGRIMKLGYKPMNESADMPQKKNTNNFSLKVQSDKFKRPLVMEMHRNDPIKIMYIKCAEQLDVHYTQIKLSFDGDILAYEDTPEQLDLEGGEIIDLLLKSK